MTPALLAIELSGAVSTLAVRTNGTTHERDFSAQRGRVLIAELDLLLAELGLARGDLRAVLVGTGPGSYTGLRIAAAAGRALGFALDIPCAGVPSLHAAVLAAPAGEPVHIALDAYRGEVYHAELLHDDAGVHERVAPQVLPRDDLAQAVPDGGAWIGDPGLLDDPARVRVLAQEVAPRAGQLLQVAMLRGLGDDGRGIESLPAADPLYLRPAAYPPPRR